MLPIFKVQQMQNILELRTKPYSQNGWNKFSFNWLIETPKRLLEYETVALCQTTNPPTGYEVCPGTVDEVIKTILDFEICFSYCMTVVYPVKQLVKSIGWFKVVPYTDFGFDTKNAKLVDIYVNYGENTRKVIILNDCLSLRNIDGIDYLLVQPKMHGSIKTRYTSKDYFLLENYKFVEWLLKSMSNVLEKTKDRIKDVIRHIISNRLITSKPSPLDMSCICRYTWIDGFTLSKFNADSSVATVSI